MSVNILASSTVFASSEAAAAAPEGSGSNGLSGRLFIPTLREVRGSMPRLACMRNTPLGYLEGRSAHRTQRLMSGRSYFPAAKISVSNTPVITRSPLLTCTQIR
jgi:hypothetical protein